jgi:hypothetical protein
MYTQCTQTIKLDTDINFSTLTLALLYLQSHANKVLYLKYLKLLEAL